MGEAASKLKGFVAMKAEGVEELLGVQAKILWSYYNQLKKEGFTDEQAFELVKNAAPKELEVKLERK